MAKENPDLDNTPPVADIYATSWNLEKSKTKKMNKGGQFEFLDSLIEAHYQESKLEYMYQFNDYFSDKYKIRQKITEEIGKKVSLKEINIILNKMLSEMRRTYNDDLTRTPEFRYLNKDFTNRDFDIFESVKADYGEEHPDIYDDDQLNTKNTNSVMKQVRDIKEKFEQEDIEETDINENDLYEIEAFKSYKNDPVFKHYLYNHLSFFAEKMNDNLSTLPFTLRGIV